MTSPIVGLLALVAIADDETHVPPLTVLGFAAAALGMVLLFTLPFGADCTLGTVSGRRWYRHLRHTVLAAETLLAGFAALALLNGPRHVFDAPDLRVTGAGAPGINVCAALIALFIAAHYTYALRGRAAPVWWRPALHALTLAIVTLAATNPAATIARLAATLPCLCVIPTGIWREFAARADHRTGYNERSRAAEARQQLAALFVARAPHGVLIYGQPDLDRLLLLLLFAVAALCGAAAIFAASQPAFSAAGAALALAVAAGWAVLDSFPRAAAWYRGHWLAVEPGALRGGTTFCGLRHERFRVDAAEIARFSVSAPATNVPRPGAPARIDFSGPHGSAAPLAAGNLTWAQAQWLSAALNRAALEVWGDPADRFAET